MIFLDTSAIYALADRDDPFHGSARERLQALINAEEGFLTHNYVLVESMALLQSRLGVPAAQRFARDARGFTVQWVDQATHDEAVRQLSRSPARQISLVDRVSFLVMQRYRVQVAFAFDSDFERAGYRLFDGNV